MHESQSNSALIPLSHEVLQQVIQRDELYEAYIDILALIQDMLCEFTDSFEKPRFTPEEIQNQVKRVFTNFYILTVTDVPEVNIKNDLLLNNMETNLNLAKEIRHRAESSETANERFEAERRATQFLHTVIETYTTLRILKRHAEPAQP